MYFSLFSVFWIKTSQISSRNGPDRKLDHCKVRKISGMDNDRKEMMQAVGLNKIIFCLYKTGWICQLGKVLSLMFCKELTEFGLSVISSV